MTPSVDRGQARQDDQIPLIGVAFRGSRKRPWRVLAEDTGGIPH